MAAASPIRIVFSRLMVRRTILWMMTFALALSAPAAAFGECCQHPAGSSSCCADRNKMPGMASNSMEPIDQPVSSGERMVEDMSARCAVSWHSALPGFVEEIYRPVERSLRTTYAGTTLLQPARYAVDPSITSRSSISRRSFPPIPLLFDPLTIALRV